MSDNSEFLNLLNELSEHKKPSICNILFAISEIDGEGIIVQIEDKSLITSEFFDGPLLRDNITEEKTIPTKPGFYTGKIKIHSFQCNRPDDPIEYDEVISLENVQLINIKKEIIGNIDKHSIKPSNIGIVVDKSNATKTFPMRSREFPPYHELNE